MKKIFLAHEIQGVPEDFIFRMNGIQKSLVALGTAEIISIGECRTQEDVNSWILRQVQTADLMIAVMDHPTDDLNSCIEARCIQRLPLRVFIPWGNIPSETVAGYIESYRKPLRASTHSVQASLHHARAAQMPDQIGYDSDEEIVHTVSDWIHFNYMPPESALHAHAA